MIKIQIATIFGTAKNNKLLLGNILGALLIRGLGMIVSLISMPLYMHYFPDNSVLGVWFTILNVLNWMLSFDLGIGNGLRNRLTIALAHNDDVEAKKLISSAYFMLGGITFSMAIIVYGISSVIDWNSFLNIQENVIYPDALRTCVNITFVGVLVCFFLRLINSILYALQLSSMTNLLHLCTSILTVIYLYVSGPSDNILDNLINLSVAHAVITTIPLVIATLIVFCFTKLRNCLPNIKLYTKSVAKSVLSLGLSFLLLQVLYMIITVTNEWFISKFFGPQYCVDYSCYYRLFAIASTLYNLALTPLWSAITKAYAEKRYNWIMKLNKTLNIMVIIFIVIQLVIIPFVPYLFGLWLGDKSPAVDYTVCFFFVVFNSILIWSGNLSVLMSGLGILRSSIYCNMVAVIVKVVGIVIVSQFINHWVVVIGVTSVALLPFCIIQPIVLKRILNQMAMQTS